MTFVQAAARGKYQAGRAHLQKNAARFCLLKSFRKDYGSQDTDRTLS